MATDRRREAKDALFDGFAGIGKALSSGRRAEIVELLAQGERTVDEVAGEIDQSIANTSHHLRTLARAGLVSSRRAGTHVHYRLASDDVLELWWTTRRVAAAQLDGLDTLARAYLGDRRDVQTITRAALLDRLERGGLDLLVVGSTTPQVRGGTGMPHDDPLQCLGRSRWTSWQPTRSFHQWCSSTVPPGSSSSCSLGERIWIGAWRPGALVTCTVSPLTRNVSGWSR
jgi:DNA-binding transcriptional ArsR family regulator